jgi:hypothetical protein
LYIYFKIIVSGPAGWPHDYQQYSLFITSPTRFTEALVDQVHADVPGSKVLAYFDSTSIPLVEGETTIFCHQVVFGFVGL